MADFDAEFDALLSTHGRFDFAEIGWIVFEDRGWIVRWRAGDLAAGYWRCRTDGSGLYLRDVGRNAWVRVRPGQTEYEYLKHDYAKRERDTLAAAAAA